MIGRLRGKLDSMGADGVLVDVGGVGYLVQMSPKCLDRLGGIGASAEVLIETIVREDAFKLYGFSGTPEKSWFSLLQDVQGVGAKVAIAVLSVLSADEIGAAISAGDHARIGQAQGVGPKLAKRIVSELKDKVPASAASLAGLERGSKPPVSKGKLAQADAVSALVNLGYALAQATNAIEAATNQLGEDAPIEALIREGLKSLAAS